MAAPEKPLVSVSVITYQHAKYISQCLDNILSQQTNFEFEILLGEDNSTDGTREICVEYKNKFPDKIRLFLQTPDRTTLSNGMAHAMNNLICTLKQAKGKYIAFCEGDDYWTDLEKLQTQVDFLEANSDYSICFHSVQCLRDGELSDNSAKFVPAETTTINDLCKQCYIQTVSCVVRRSAIADLPDDFVLSPVGDYYIFLLAALNGKIKFIDRNMAIYRQHAGGVWSRLSELEKMEKSAEVHNFMRARFQSVVKDLLTEEYIKRLEEIVRYYKRAMDNPRCYGFYLNGPVYISSNFKLVDIVFSLGIKFKTLVKKNIIDSFYR